MPYLRGFLWGLVGAVLAAVIALVVLALVALRVQGDDNIGAMSVSVSTGPLVIAGLVGFVAGFLRGVRRSRPRVGLRA